MKEMWPKPSVTALEKGDIQRENIARAAWVTARNTLITFIINDLLFNYRSATDVD